MEIETQNTSNQPQKTNIESEITTNKQVKSLTNLKKKNKQK